MTVPNGEHWHYIPLMQTETNLFKIVEQANLFKKWQLPNFQTSLAKMGIRDFICLCKGA